MSKSIVPASSLSFSKQGSHLIWSFVLQFKSVFVPDTSKSVLKVLGVFGWLCTVLDRACNATSTKALASDFQPKHSTGKACAFILSPFCFAFLIMVVESSFTCWQLPTHMPAPSQSEKVRKCSSFQWQAPRRLIPSSKCETASSNEAIWRA